MIHTHKDVKYPKLNSQVIHKVKIPSIVQIFTILISLDTIIANCPPISRYHPSFNENIYTGRAIFAEHNLPRVTTVPVKNEEAANPTPTIIPLLFPPVITPIPFHFLSSSVYISLLSPPFTPFFVSHSYYSSPTTEKSIWSGVGIRRGGRHRVPPLSFPFNSLVSLVFPALVALST